MFNRKIHYGWWCYLAILNYQRVTPPKKNESFAGCDQGLINVQIKHHPTIGDIISNKYLKVMSEILNSWDIYQPVVIPEIHRRKVSLVKPPRHFSPPPPGFVCNRPVPGDRPPWPTRWGMKKNTMGIRCCLELLGTRSQKTDWAAISHWINYITLDTGNDNPIRTNIMG